MMCIYIGFKPLKVVLTIVVVAKPGLPAEDIYVFIFDIYINEIFIPEL